MPTFADFTVGQVYKQKVSVTNISFGRCAFKVLPLPDDVADVLEVAWTPAGHLSAGTACELLVTFTPRENCDVDTAIPLLAQTGPLAIPLKCRTKKAAVSADTSVVDFGAPVPLGRSCRKLVTLRNDGALQVCSCE